MKPYRVDYVQLTGWEADIVGLWLAENEDWLLLRQIPSDYIVDGYILVSKVHMISRKPNRRYGKQTEQILKLKGIKAELPPAFRFGSTVELLRWIERQYGIMEFADEEETTFLGWVAEVDAVHLWINFLTPKATLIASDGQEKPHVLSEIQFIRFDTDYANSLNMLWQHKQRLKLRKPSDN